MIKKYVLEGLACANCAAKIEEAISVIPKINSAYINFATKTLVVDFEGPEDEMWQQIKRVIKKIEPDALGEKDMRAKKMEILAFAIGIIIFSIAIFVEMPFAINLTLYIISYLLIGGEILFSALKNLLHGKVFDENFLMSIATIGAFALGEFTEAVAVMFFFRVGEFFEEMAVNRSTKSIKNLLDIRPDFATLKKDGELLTVDPLEVKIGDVILVKPGEKIPLDGVVLEGESIIDTSALTGEFVPVAVSAGVEVLSGSINQNGVLSIKVSTEFANSTVSKILDLVQNASSKKAPTEKFITKFSKIYTPVVVLLALALAIIPPLFTGLNFAEWVRRALLFLVISCPCALVLSIPLGFFGGIGAASRSGILVKGGNFLEALNKVDTVIFDKTGTLTKGVFKVVDIIPENLFSKDEILEFAAYAEFFSSHPIAISIKNRYNKNIDENRLSEYSEIAGNGVSTKLDSKKLLVGNKNFVNAPFENTAESTAVYVSVDGVYGGCILISDEIKQDSELAVSSLRKLGVKHIAMLTGDKKEIGESISKKLALDDVYSELLPHEKIEKAKSIKSKTEGTLVFVGDGINDAPTLAHADVGIAMGGIGSAAAIEAADVIIMNDEPSKIATAIKISRKTRKIVLQNIVFAIGVKFIVLVLGALGIATMWEAVFADVGVALIAILNSMRTMKGDYR